MHGFSEQLIYLWKLFLSRGMFGCKLIEDCRVCQISQPPALQHALRTSKFTLADESQDTYELDCSSSGRGSATSSDGSGSVSLPAAD